MDYRNHKSSTAQGPIATFKRALLKSTLFTAFAVVALAAASQAAELPNAPSSSLGMEPAMVETTSTLPVTMPKTEVTKPIDSKFLALAFISTGSTFADSYTTLFARQNWLAHKQGVCNMEVESAYLYGTHPTVGRAYAVASVKSAGSALMAYYLRKHHSRFWSLPMVANSIVSLQGVTQNMIECN